MQRLQANSNPVPATGSGWARKKFLDPARIQAWSLQSLRQGLLQELCVWPRGILASKQAVDEFSFISVNQEASFPPAIGFESGLCVPFPQPPFGARNKLSGLREVGRGQESPPG